ncbi:hypothetical protein B0J14DRAFT_671256 [Halenospora varia]|nr:hypothetical protein B0J14DRAFT_671256 [Halenospora varia]
MCFVDTNRFACQHVERQAVTCPDMILSREEPGRISSGCPNGVEAREKWHNFDCRQCELNHRKMPAAVRVALEFGREVSSAISAVFSEESKAEGFRGHRGSMAVMMGDFHTIMPEVRPRAPAAHYGDGWRIPVADGTFAKGQKLVRKIQGAVGLQKEPDLFSRSLYPPFNLIVKRVDVVVTIEDKLRKLSVAPGSQDILQTMARRGKSPGLLEKGVTAAQGLFKPKENVDQSTPSSMPLQDEVVIDQTEEEITPHEPTLAPMAAMRTVDIPRRREPRADLPDRPVSVFLTSEQEQEAFTPISRADRLSRPGVDDRADLTSQRAQRGTGTLQRRTRTQRRGRTAKQDGPLGLSSEVGQNSNAPESLRIARRPVPTLINTDEKDSVDLGGSPSEIPSQLSQGSSEVAQAKPRVPEIAIEFAVANNWLQLEGHGEDEMASRASSSSHLAPPPIPRRSSRRPRTRSFALMNSEAIAANSANTATASAIQIGPSQIVQPSRSRLQVPAQTRAARPFTDFSQLQQSNVVDPDEEEDTIRRLREVAGNYPHRFEGSSFFGLFRR